MTKDLIKIQRKSLLYKSKVDYADYAINHFEGCSHGCTFPCYEMMRRMRRGEIANYAEWTNPKMVENTLTLLERELSRRKKDISSVFMCFTTDPFMYGQKMVEDLTLKVIKKVNEEGIKCVLLTKGVYPKKLMSSEFSNKNEYGITFVSLKSEFQKKFEPGASPLDKRLESLKYLHDQGLKTWVSVEPYPTPNIISQDFQELLEKIKFVDKVIFGSWNYNKSFSKYPNKKQFYLDCSETLKKFCKKNGIKYHVKIKGQDFDRYKNLDIFKN